MTAFATAAAAPSAAEEADPGDSAINAGAACARAMRATFRSMLPKPEGSRDENKVQAGLAQFREALVPWQGRLEGRPFLMGDLLTLADIALFTPLFGMVRLVGENGEILATFTALRGWRDRMTARPSTAY